MCGTHVKVRKGRDNQPSIKNNGKINIRLQEISRDKQNKKIGPMSGFI